MARRASITGRELVPLLQSRAPVSASELATMLGVNRSTVVRVLAGFGAELVRMGEARATRYALRREVRGAGNAWPVYRIDSAGRAAEFARVEALHDALWRVVWPGEVPAWAERFSDRRGLWSGFPFFLTDMRPQGYLGRVIARQVSIALQVPEDPRQWSDEHSLVFLQAAGEDLPGDLVVGDGCLRRALGRGLSRGGVLESDYPALADQAAAGLPGTSAGGEQPKFLAMAGAGGNAGREVLVKFSPPLDQATGRRWADLLCAECRALTILAGAGLALPGARVFDTGGRRFLEVPRFDRTAGGGRRGVVSLEALFAAASGSFARGWDGAVGDLVRDGIASGDSLHTVRRLQAFGELIGNSDMHAGNLAFWLDDGARYRVAPAYDMLPMLWAPTMQGELPQRELSPDPPLPAALEAWLEAAEWALEFWQGLVVDELVSSDFAGRAGKAEETVRRLVAGVVGP